MTDSTLGCPRCRQPLAPGERCPTHGLYALPPEAAEALEDAPLLGQVLNGQFALTGLIGHGGMGIVYRGLDLNLHRDVAVKVVHAHLTSTRKDRERFEREARAVSRLRSPSTVTLFQFGVVSEGTLANLAFMVMELVEGVSLAARLRAGPLAAAEVADILEQMGDSLGEAHQQGIVHRDLKPENILLTHTHDRRLRVKIIDFGIARLEGATRTGSGLLSGTPQYMAPEQCNGTDSSELDGRVDVYACGVVAFQALTGNRPFDGTDPLQILMKQVNLAPPHLPGHRDGGPMASLDGVLQRALAKAREGRFGTVAELARTFRQALGEGHAPALPAAVAPVEPASDTLGASHGELRPVAPAASVSHRTRRRILLGSAAGAAVVGVVLALAGGRPVGSGGAEKSNETAQVAFGVATPVPASAVPVVGVEVPVEPVVQPVTAPPTSAPAVVAEPEVPASRPPARPRRPATGAAAEVTTLPTAAPVTASADGEARRLMREAEAALKRCDCSTARERLKSLRKVADHAVYVELATRIHVCTLPDVDEVCDDGTVRPR